MDLANELLKQTYRKRLGSYYELSLNRSVQSLRSAIANAKRFTLDESMSEFCAVLASTPFKAAKERQADILHSLRHSAIPPYPKMLIQVDNHAFRRGLLVGGLVDKGHAYAWNPPHDGRSRVPDANDFVHDARGEALQPPSDEVIRDIAWLIEYDGQDVIISEFFVMSEKNEHEVLALPYKLIYSTQDHSFTDGKFRDGYIDIKSAMIAHGITQVRSPHFGVLYNTPIEQQTKSLVVEEPGQPSWKVNPLIVEFGGVLRYVIAFLATLNNIPKVTTVVRPQKGFLGGGRIRKYMDYTTLTLKLPQRTTQVNLAKRLIAKARKGWHEVRPHWRMLSDGNCAFHIWSERDSTGHAYCKECAARRVWIVLPHGRGDPTISIRTHKYVVTHPKE